MKSKEQREVIRLYEAQRVELIGAARFYRAASEMNATTVAVDPAKSVYQIAVADANWVAIESPRLIWTQFEHWFANREVGLVVMEACGSAHHWARWLSRLGSVESITHSMAAFVELL